MAVSEDRSELKGAWESWWISSPDPRTKACQANLGLLGASSDSCDPKGWIPLFPGVILGENINIESLPGHAESIYHPCLLIQNRGHKL